MLIKTIFKAVCIVLIMRSSLQGSCYPPIPPFSGKNSPQHGASGWEEYNSIMLILAQGYCLNKGYVKPIKTSVLLERLNDAMPSLPQVLHRLVFGYLGWEPSSRYERLYPNNRVQSIVLFEDYISRSFKDDIVNFRNFFAAFERKNKKIWNQVSSMQLLNRCLHDFESLGVDYEASPYQFTKGRMVEHFCNICGNKQEFIMLYEKFSGYAFRQDVINALRERGRTSVDTAELLTRTMKETMTTIEYPCFNNCKKKELPVLLQETFLEAPQFLLLSLTNRPSIDVKASKYVELHQRFGQPALKYELYGAVFANKYEDTDGRELNSTNTHLKGSLNTWYLYWGSKRIKIHDPFNGQEELVSYEGVDVDKYRASSSYDTLVSSYPQLMFYKKE